MATEVGSLIRVMGGYSDDHHNHRRRHHNQMGGNEFSTAGDSGTAPVTRDFLGGGGSPSYPRVEVQELDLDLEVPSGFEKRLDLESGKVYLQRCDSMNSAHSPSAQKHRHFQTVPNLEDLNFPPSSMPRPTLSLFDEPSMELKLFPSSPSASTSTASYQSVCTLDKVKSALERAEKHSTKKHSPLQGWSKSPSPSHSSSSMKGIEEYNVEKPTSLSSSPPASGLLFAAGCPSCLLYVLISKSNPVCPRCHTTVPSPATTIASKKPRLDLNISV